MQTLRSADDNPVRPPRAHRGHAVRAHRGQALIMAVLLMFLLVGLGGVFIAMINQTQIETARAAERAKLEQIAQAGMKLAESGLHHSASGADWRPGAGPDANNPGWHYDANGGFYRITVVYAGIAPITSSKPFGTNPLDRYLKIDVEARFTLANPPDVPADSALRASYEDGYESGKMLNKKFLTRKITAYAPIALTDYLVWITNLYETSEPATLGSDVTLSTHDEPSGKLRTVRGNPALFDDDVLSTTAYATAINASYLSVYNGGIRSERDLQVGNAAVYLTKADASYTTNFLVVRDDIVTIRGQLAEYANSTATARRVLVNRHSEKIGAVDSATNFEPVVARTDITLVQYLETADNNSSVPALRAPKIDASGLERYRALTRDSGYDAGAFHTGEIGWGEGVYINNDRQTQYTGATSYAEQLAQLRDNWISATGECWSYGVYNPVRNNKAVKIILHDWEFDSDSFTATAVSAPYIELWSTDINNDILHQKDGTNAASTSINGVIYHYVTMPYPRNGVLFAEGNIEVSGHLPASVAFNSDFTPIWNDTAQRWGGFNKADQSTRYYVSPTNRRFDLTIVSAGTIYIAGNLLGPASRKDRSGNYLTQDGAGFGTIRNGSAYDSKLALLAADSVCLNPTRLFDDMVSLDPELSYKGVTLPDGSLYAPTPDPAFPSEWFWQADTAVNSAFVFSFSTAGPVHPRTRLLLRHAGDENAASSSTVLQMRVNNWTPPFYWNPAAGESSATNLYFCTTATISTIYPWLNALLPTPPSDPLRLEWPRSQWGGSRYSLYLTTPPYKTFGMQSWDITNAAHYSGLAVSMPAPLFGYDRLNRFLFNVVDLPDDPYDGGNYLLHAGNRKSLLTNEFYGPGVLATCVDLQVDALVYAQRGSWFIIPGAYWHDSEDGTATNEFKWPFPKYREPYDVRIIVNGAIAQNNTAPPEMERQWIEHWRGSNLWYYDENNDGKPDMWDPASAGWDANIWRWQDPLRTEQDPLRDNRRMGIIYTYDATLALPVCYDVDPEDPSIRYYTPRLPKLPVGPEMLSVQDT
ncbi:MAG: hypothetical protein ACYC6A_20755 [Armatimonadota bacterium]